MLLLQLTKKGWQCLLPAMASFCQLCRQKCWSFWWWYANEKCRIMRANINMSVKCSTKLTSICKSCTNYCSQNEKKKNNRRARVLVLIIIKKKKINHAVQITICDNLSKFHSYTTPSKSIGHELKGLKGCDRKTEFWFHSQEKLLWEDAHLPSLTCKIYLLNKNDRMHDIPNKLEGTYAYSCFLKRWKWKQCCSPDIHNYLQAMKHSEIWSKQPHTEAK